MSIGSTIEWTSATWNPVSGCTRASAGCDNCYAVKQTYRLERMGQTSKYGGLTVLNKNGDRHFNGVVRCHEDTLKIPLGWKKPRRVFVNSMSDLFHKGVPFDFIDKVFAVMAVTPRFTYQVLTKRPERMASYLRERSMGDVVTAMRHESESRPPFGEMNYADYVTACFNVDDVFQGTREGVTGYHDAQGRKRIYPDAWPLPNVWAGFSAENQENFDWRWEHARSLAQAGWLTWCSAEPLLGPLKLPDSALWAGLKWLVVGGESGPGARPFNVQWARDIIAQCKAAGVPVFCKQLGAHVIDRGTTSADHFEEEQCWPDGTRTDHHRVLLKDKKGGDWSEWPTDLRVREFPEAAAVLQR